MAQNTTITVPPRAWTQLTNADATNVTVQIINSNGAVLLKPAIGAVAPTDELGALRLPKEDFILNTALQNIFPGADAVTRLYAYAEDGADVLISHA